MKSSTKIPFKQWNYSKSFHSPNGKFVSLFHRSQQYAFFIPFVRFFFYYIIGSFLPPLLIIVVIEMVEKSLPEFFKNFQMKNWSSLIFKNFIHSF